MDGIIASAFIIPGHTGEIAKCALQITSMLHAKPSETFAVASATRKAEADIIRRVKYIGLLQVSPALRPIEIMTSVHESAYNDCVLFFDGDAAISPMSLTRLFEAYRSQPDAVYCAALKDLGDIDGFVYGSYLSEDGSSKPIIADEKRTGRDQVECLQYGCIVASKSVLSDISQDSPVSCIEELSRKLTDKSISMYCVNDSFISYKGLTNLGVETSNA
tara:strand:+ start:16371 stop:17024 length:654 start_codon:yes stop_codon:yes gene_type:complete